MTNINDIYVDVITGHLHVTLNELFKIRANYILLEKEFLTVSEESGKQKTLLLENAQQIDEQIKIIQKLENEYGTLKHETKVKELDSTKINAKLTQLENFVGQINSLKTELTAKEDEITKLKSEITTLKNKPKKIK